jgi:hypothetical protein
MQGSMTIEDKDQKLWEAVIMQAIRDATLSMNSNSLQLAKQKARDWLTKPNGDFEAVCSLADLQPHHVRAAAQQLIAESDRRAHSDKPSRRGGKARLITFNNLTLTFNQWSERCGVDAQTLRVRLHKGWSIERTLTTPRNRKAPGVVRDFNTAPGTGGGSIAHDLPEIEFLAPAKELEPCP